MSLLERIRNPSPRRPPSFWGLTFWVCCALSMLNTGALLGDPFLWQLTEGEQTRAVIYQFGFAFLAIAIGHPGSHRS